MSFWFFTLEGISSYFGMVDVTFGPLDPGNNILANISLSQINTVFAGNSSDPKFVASAWIDSWTFYQDDGTESPPQQGAGFTQDAVFVPNCATIKFVLIVEQAWAIAQINASTV